jgi:hypothetical protein
VRFNTDDFEKETATVLLNVRVLSSSSTRTLSDIEESIEHKIIELVDEPKIINLVGFSEPEKHGPLVDNELLNSLVENIYKQKDFSNLNVATRNQNLSKTSLYSNGLNSFVEVSPDKFKPSYSNDGKAYKT